MVSRLKTIARGAPTRVPPPTHRQAAQPRRFVLALPLAAVLLMLLSTCICILHCHTFITLRTATPTTTLIVFSPDAAIVCHTPAGEVPALPAPLDAGALRALSEAAPTLAGLLLLTLLVHSPAELSPAAPLKPLTSLAPEPPPPRP
jgi:hypothetical protein